MCPRFDHAVRHTRSQIAIDLHCSSGEITVEITDDKTHVPQRRLPDADEESGRGLMLVEALADAWGTRPTDTGKTVWFTLNLGDTG